MAYTHSKYEVMMQPAAEGSVSVGGAVGATQVLSAGGINLFASGIVGTWSPGFVPHFIRGAAIISTASDTVDAIAFPVGIEIDVSTPGTPTLAFRLSLPSGGGANAAHYYRPTYQIEVKPGMTVNVRPTTPATSGVRANIILYVEPRWEEPSNVTTMTAVTAIP